MLGLGETGPEHGDSGTGLLQAHARLIHIQLRHKVRLIPPTGDVIRFGLGSQVGSDNRQAGLARPILHVVQLSRPAAGRVFQFFA